MPINSDKMEIIKKAIHYSILLKQETQNDDEFKDSPSMKGQIETEIHFREQFRDELQDRTEESLMDDDQLCSVLSNSITFLTGYHYGRRVTEKMEKDIEPIKKIQEKFCTKKPHEYID